MMRHKILILSIITLTQALLLSSAEKQAEPSTVTKIIGTVQTTAQDLASGARDTASSWWHRIKHYLKQEMPQRVADVELKSQADARNKSADK